MDDNYRGGWNCRHNWQRRPFIEDITNEWPMFGLVPLVAQMLEVSVWEIFREPWGYKCPELRSTSLDEFREEMARIEDHCRPHLLVDIGGPRIPVYHN